MWTALLSNKWTQYALIGLVVLVVVGVVLWYLNKQKREREEEAFDKTYDYANALAVRVRGAINPSGVSWLKSGDGTDERTLLQLATEIGTRKRMEAVATAYRKKYGSGMLSDIEQELSAQELQKFNSYIK